MLNPTESPPPSFAPAVRGLHHAGAAAGHDGQARLGESSRGLASRLVRGRPLLHPRRAEDRHGGPVDPLHLLEAGEELRGDQRHVAHERPVRTPQEPSVDLVVRAHSLSCGTCATTIPATSAAAVASETTATTARPPARARGSAAPPPARSIAPRAEHVAAVEDPDRREVDQVEEEARVGERAQEVGARLHGDDQARGGADTARDRPGERHARVHPRVEAHVPKCDVGAEERDEDRELRVEPRPLRLDVVAELVDEDEQDDADRELPAPDERVAADREEDPEELEHEGAELDEHAERHGERREQPAEQRPPRAVVLARQRPRLRRGDGLQVVRRS